MKQKQLYGDKKVTLFQGRFFNHNDPSETTFYLCVGIYGSYCMPCPRGTTFIPDLNNKATGACGIKKESEQSQSNEDHW